MPTSSQRVQISVATRAIIRGNERPARMVALSATSALLLTAEPLGAIGDTLELIVPGVGQEIRVAAGIDRVESVTEGFVTTVEFMFDSARVRTALSTVLTLLLDGPGGGRREHPRVTCQAPMRYGPEGQSTAQLEELSRSGLLMRTTEPLVVRTQLRLFIQHPAGNVPLALRGEVKDLRRINARNYLVGVAFIGLDEASKQSLARLLSHLLR